MFAKPKNPLHCVLNDSAGQIIRALKGNEVTGMCKCVVHDDKTASLHISDDGGRLLVHCFGGCEQSLVINALKSRGLWSMDPKPPIEQPTRYELEMQKRDKLLKASAILRTAARERKTPKAYLDGRGLRLVPENAMLLSAVKTQHSTGTLFPAMILPIGGPNGLQGAQVTFLNSNANANVKKSDGKNARKIYGSAAGGYIHASPLDPKRPLIVSEGFETALAAAQISGLPAVAAVSAGNMKNNFVPPPCTELIIAADADEPGRQAAEALASRISTPARIAYPPPPHNDWNDCVRASHDPTKLKKLLLEAPLWRHDRDENDPETQYEPAGPERATDLGNARRLVRLHGQNIRYVHALGAWFIWTGNRWKRDDSGAIMRIAKKVTEAMFAEAAQIENEDDRKAARKFAFETQKRERLAAMVALAQSELPVVLSADKIDANPMLLAVKNGVIELATGKFREGRREDYITKQAGVSYDADATCPNWLAFQKKISEGNRELIAYKQRLAGLLLTGLVEEVLFITWGGGQNGKSSEWESIAEILGDFAGASGASVLTTQKQAGAASPEIVALKGKRALFVNETQEQCRLNESRVKYLASNDTIAGRDLYEKIITFLPTHKTLLRTNHKPVIRGTDKGIWRRIHLIPYLVTIPEDERNTHFREEHLRPELPGIFNWCLEGLADYLENGLKPPPCVQKATDDYRADMDLVQQWLAARCERKPKAETALKDLTADFNVFLEGENAKPWPSRRLSSELCNRFGFAKERMRTKRNVDAIVGLTLKE